ncbi:hypothetical protein [Streptomyces ardesiacus]|uniref:hypothetical protein n=1 Tax=Streptomyces ardesiacus TaxID=285564 RepID=UPI00381EB9C1
MRNELPCCSCTWSAKSVSVKPDARTLGVLVLYTRGLVADWVDVVVSDLALASLAEARLIALEAEMGAPMSELEVARKQFDRGHAEIPGSSSFTIIRLSKVGARKV